LIYLQLWTCLETHELMEKKVIMMTVQSRQVLHKHPITACS
jgi:hypothetical protein